MISYIFISKTLLFPSEIVFRFVCFKIRLLLMVLGKLPSERLPPEDYPRLNQSLTLTQAGTFSGVILRLAIFRSPLRIIFNLT